MQNECLHRSELTTLQGRRPKNAILRPVATTNRSRLCSALPEKGLERASSRIVPQLEQRLLLDLPHSLARDLQQRTDVLERHRIGAIKSEVEAQNLGLSLFQGGQRFLDRLRQRLLERDLVRSRIHVVGEIIEQAIVLARRHRRIERQMHLRDHHRLGDFVLADVHAFRDLEVGRLTTELLEEAARSLPDAVQRPGAIERHTHDARLLGQRLEDRLADPPHRVRDELDALRLVEFVGGANEAEVALVDQIGECDSLILIFLRYGDDESEIRSDECIEGFLIIQADALRELHFSLASNEGKDADVPEVLIERSLVDGRFPIRRNLHSDSVILSEIERSSERSLRSASTVDESANPAGLWCRARSYNRPLSVGRAQVSRPRTPNTSNPTSCRDYLRGRSSHEEGRSEGPSCYVTDGNFRSTLPLQDKPFASGNRRLTGRPRRECAAHSPHAPAASFEQVSRHAFGLYRRECRRSASRN